MIVNISTADSSELQAEDGVGLPGEVLEHPNFERAANLYFWFISLNPMWSLNLAVLLVLNFFEVTISSESPVHISIRPSSPKLDNSWTTRFSLSTLQIVFTFILSKVEGRVENVPHA